jgi:hypothetical protein
MATSELVLKSAAELAPLLKSRKLSPVELVRACLDRIDAVNPKVNAFITVTADQALKQARRAEREIATGRYRGPLHGLPYAPKDLFATKGIRTTNGSKTTSNWTSRIHRRRPAQPGRRDPDRQAQPGRVRDGQRPAWTGRTRAQSVGSELFAIGLL